MDGVNGLWEPLLRFDEKREELQCFYSAENGPRDQDGFVRASEDGGRTWGKRRIVSGDGVLSRDGMMGCVGTGWEGEVL